MTLGDVLSDASEMIKEQDISRKSQAIRRAVADLLDRMEVIQVVSDLPPPRIETTDWAKQKVAEFERLYGKDE